MENLPFLQSSFKLHWSFLSHPGTKATKPFFRDSKGYICCQWVGCYPARDHDLNMNDRRVRSVDIKLALKVPKLLRK